MKIDRLVAVVAGALLLVTPLAHGAKLTLKTGLNLVAFAANPDPALTSQSLPTVFGLDLIAVSRIDVPQQTVETTVFQGGVQGANFPILVEEAYLVHMAADAVVELSGVTADVTVDLAPGINLVGFSPVVPHYRAFDLLKLVGDADAVASIQRFDRESAQFRVAIQTADGMSGDNFRIVPGEGVLISMLGGVNGVKPPFFFISGSSGYLLHGDVFSGGGGGSASASFKHYSVIGQPSPLDVMTSPSFQLKAGFLSAPR